MMRILFTLAIPFAVTGSKYALSKKIPKKNKSDPTTNDD
jgi:hypothetical protein